VRVDDNREGRPLALARLQDRTLAFVADEDDATLHTVDLTSGKEIALTPLPGAPAQVLVLKDGRVAVTLRDRNQLQILEPTANPENPLDSLCTVELPTEPIGLAASPDDRLVLVTSGWGQALSALDGDSLRVSFQVPLAREPRAVVVSGDGSTAYISHVVGSRASAVDLGTPEHPVRTVDLSGQDPNLAQPRSRSFVKAVGNAFRAESLRNNRSACQGFALTRSSDPQGRIFAPQVLVDPGNAEVPSGGYGDGFLASEVASVGVIDEASGETIRASLQLRPEDGQLHMATRECLLPRSAAVDPSRKSLFVSCLGGDMVVEYDAAAPNPHGTERRRWSVPAGPTGVAVDGLGHRLVVWSQFDQALSVVDLSEQATARRPVTLALSRKAKTAAEGDLALGRKIFHAAGNTAISQDGRTCASCHPDGRDDALTWSTPEGPRNTPMLAGRLHKTGPFGWNGSSSTVQEHLHQTFQRLRGSGLQEHELAALDSFLHAMHTPRLRTPAPGSEMAKVARGKEIFESADSACATCHRTDDAFIDRTKHDVGSKAKADNETSFDTPTLRFVGATAPYFHDGRYATLREMLLGHDGKMGRTSHLKPADLEALEAYLQTLLPPRRCAQRANWVYRPRGPCSPRSSPRGSQHDHRGQRARPRWPRRGAARVAPSDPIPSGPGRRPPPGSRSGADAGEAQRSPARSNHEPP
jgi:cytochrome c peroxidase